LTSHVKLYFMESSERPSRRVGDMAWHAWGDPAHGVSLSTDTRTLIEQVLGVELAEHTFGAEQELT
jgi:hypothetical protein